MKKIFLFIAGILLLTACSDGRIVAGGENAIPGTLEEMETELKEKIAIAQARINEVDVSLLNGADIDPSKKWITQLQYNALLSSLDTAKNISAKSSPSKTEVYYALLDLSSAIEISQPKNGTKSGEYVVTFPVTDSPAPSFADVTVHDPSVFRVTDSISTNKYRVIGSFLASASTGDFIRWSSIQGSGVYNTSNRYYPHDNHDSKVQTMAQQRADVLRASPNDGLNFFASDIHRMPDGKFFHYYSLTSTWKSSAIGVAIADSVNGPYITQGLFVRSAEAGQNKAPDGSTYINISSSITNHPNCIDAQAFIDKHQDKFYMVYGSWSGGIFIYEIDKTTGLPSSDPMNKEFNGYGRKLIATSHIAIEAPYILYSPESDYYYLFVSYGGLSSAGEPNLGRYQMRVFRSRNPDGPYGCAANPSTPSLLKPLVSSNLSSAGARDFRNFGVKILGGYQFEQIAGENSLENRQGRNGYVSPGHNSAYYDADTGKYFLIFHTRFNGGWDNNAEAHRVRVHEIFMNEDGWLVASPFRYDGGSVRAFRAKQLEGAWKILSHGKNDNRGADNVNKSQNYTFHSDGAITGAGIGTWVLKEDGKTAHITLNGKLYKGFFLRCWDEFHSVWVYAFTALSGDGIALWGATPGTATNLNVN